MSFMKRNKETEHNTDNYFVTIYGKKYAFDMNKIKDICVESSNDEDAENEITTTFEKDDNGNLEISGKLIREIKSGSNAQNGMIIYDVIKLFIIRLMENSEIMKVGSEVDFSTSLALNTLINCGILIEIK